MQKVNITLLFEDEKLGALEIFLKKENTTVKKRLEESLRQLYESAVPEAVREFLDCKAAATARDRSHRSAPKLSSTKPPAQTRSDIPAQGEEAENQ